MHEAVPSASIGCGRCKSPIEASDLRCAVCGLPTLIERAAVAAAIAQVLRCESCGAAVSYDVDARAPKCGFCGSVMHVETPEDPLEEARAYLPLTVDPQAAQAGLRRWLGGLGFFRPSDLGSAAAIASLKPLWWVGWVFDAQVVVSWCCDSEAGSRRAAWAPHAGQGALDLQRVLVPASRGLSDEECRAIAGGYNVASAGPPPPAEEGVLLERFDVQRSAARAAIAAGLERAAMGYANTWVPGTRRRKLSVAVMPTRLTSDRLAFPAYVLAYRYKEKLYRAVICGQDPSVIIGKAPYSIAKIVGVIVGAIAAVALVIAIVTLTR
ncbi:MAG: hypothetical protein R3B09_00900 [Nannocystaceae bacterium]